MRVRDLDFPDDLHYFVERHTWARREPDGSVTCGMTSLGAALAGELMGCMPKSLALAIERDRAMAVVELAKAVTSVRAPIAGTVVAANEALKTEPERIGRDPYGEGWIVRFAPEDWARDAAQLVHGPGVAEAMERAMVRERYGE